MIALNPDLIERVEATPDTVVTLIDEKKFLIEESLDDVLRLITDYRAYIIARSRDIAVTDYDPGGRPVLHVVPDELVSNIGSDHGIDDRQAAALGAVRPIDQAGDPLDDGPDPQGGRFA
jgi:uncharacterized protein YlzI (FlbEa/FlbD family)